MPREPAGNEKINLYFNSQVLAALKRIALVRGTSYSELIREGMRNFVLSEGPKVLGEAKSVKELGK